MEFNVGFKSGYETTAIISKEDAVSTEYWVQISELQNPYDLADEPVSVDGVPLDPDGDWLIYVDEQLCKETVGRQMNKQESHKTSIIRVVEPGELMEVISASGKTYKIRYCGSGDGDPEYIAVWKCNCPAGSHGRDCKHMRAFLNSGLMDYEGDEEDGIPQEIEF